jgi:hypothetical protein
MKKQFAKLSKAEREKIEAAYHSQNPQEFDNLMSRAKLHRPGPKSRPKLHGSATQKTKTPLKQV